MSNIVTVQEKLDRAKVLFAEAKAILTNPEAPAEDKAKIEGLMEEAKALRTEAARLQEIEKAASEIVAQAETAQGNEEAKQARQDKTKFKDWGEFLYQTWRALNPRLKTAADPRLQWYQDKDEESDSKSKKDLGETVGGSGGFLVPVEFLPQMQAIEAEQSLFVSRATLIRMRRRQIQVPVLDQITTTAGIPHWFGGILFYHGEENVEKNESDPKFRQVTLTANKLYGYTRSGDELLDDEAVGLADFLSGPLGFAGGAAWIKDYEFLRGTGVGQPLGVINAGATITVARAAQNAVGLVDLLNMLENFLPSGRGMWAYTQSALAELMQISGPAGNASYVFMPSAREGVPDTIFGMPAARTEKCPRIGTAGDFVLADWRYYLNGDRQASTIESTQFDRWRYDQTSWRMVTRYDGRPWLSAPLTYEDGTTQVSPFVILGDKTT